MQRIEEQRVSANRKRKSSLALRLSPALIAAAAGGAVLYGDAAPAQAGAEDLCNFKIGAVSVWFGTEPPVNLQNAGQPLWDWAINNNQITGPAADRTVDISAQADNRRIGTLTTDADGIGRSESGSKYIRGAAPKQPGVQRFFEGKMRDTALVALLDRATNRTHIHEVLCECLYNARVPRWMKTQPEAAPTPTPTPVPENPTPAPTPKEICAPAQVPLPCSTKEMLFEPNKSDTTEVGRSRLGNMDLIMSLPNSAASNLSIYKK